MHSDQEPNSLFGGLAAQSWNSNNNGNFELDLAEKCNWLFKIEMEKH